MLKIGLIGLGYMGRMHFSCYKKLEEASADARLTAICDGDALKFQGIFAGGNIQVPSGQFDFSPYRQYTDIDRMLEEEELDMVDIALPTYLHAEVAVKALNKGIHVLCEKPMALTSAQGEAMIRAAEQSGKKLMIAQCLRFWPEYEYLKETVESGRYGKVLGAYFFRGGHPPKWTFNDWMIKESTSGGGLLDLHIHDVDLVHWLFGKPQSVSTIARSVLPESAYDILSTNYLFDDNKVVNTQIDRSLGGEFGFEMAYRVNFEGGNLLFENRVLKDNPNDGKGFVPQLPAENGYYREIRYFIDAVQHDKPIERSAPHDSLMTLKIVEAEKRSADSGGIRVTVA
ncbi:Gfo/Idh/MocA family protein [Paenibacillus allorhizosphaerae]|uniref:Inositol 2-dehydrogenase/D-chiro-inositol 3-dehydrogenase n=1 Tax=Paenibacillus allorhizosphaerae TaxID=2849866 RepID=A0ABN7TGG1_9BACL|nr:Gfo/Idh/MocA family oxidoreductase [Paenibacillus allorhizosphaerae]CAG7618192.1 Inositol 2-dehydrogenase/D-chiro-inositol 3-dehydrogenase [Paenibacillus allorhizosphaerae]